MHVLRRGARGDAIKRAKRNVKLTNCLDGRTTFKKAFMYQTFNSIHVSPFNNKKTNSISIY